MVLRFTLLAVLLWTVLIGASAVYNIDHAKKSSLEQAYAEAQAILNKDITFRRWGTGHGGVYVPVGENQQPIPFMSHVPGRDVVTTDGEALTLVNPASMLRQMMDSYARDFGVRGRITGLKYLNPGNAPDPWETEQITNFTKDMNSPREVWKLAEIDGQPFLRYLRAMHMEDGCQKCHGHLGYEIGEVRGATGINLPMKTYLQRYNTIRLDLLVTHFLIWLIVLSSIIWIGRKAARQAEILEQTVKERTSELEASRDAAEYGLRSREQFIANMSHEIRTPMNAIMGYSEVVSHDPRLTDSSKKRVGIIYSSATSLLGMLNDILDFSKIDSGKLSLESTPFHLRNAVADLFSTSLYRLQEKGLEFSVQFADDLPMVVNGDPTRLRQVLSNLLDNAIKFTDKGSISLDVSMSDDHESISFSLKDTGIGMNQDQLSRIFEPFIQADQSTTRRFGGTGLGTGISKELVELMGGELWVESIEGEGSTFHFTVKFSVASDADEFLYSDTDQIDERYQSPRSFRVLLAEDLEANAELVILWLEDQGHSVVWAQNGREAIARFKEKEFDLVLMDIQMPFMDGLDASSAIRKYERDQIISFSTPIIALTASVMREDVDKCKSVGINTVISKPVNRNELLRSMESLVREGVGISSNQNEKKSSSFNDFDLIAGVADSKVAKERWDVLEPYVAALRMFAAKHKDDPAVLVECLSQNPQESKRALLMLHALKGVSGNLALSKIELLSGQLENLVRLDRGDHQEKLLSELSDSMEHTISAIEAIELDLESPEQFIDEAESSEKMLVRLERLLDAVDQLDPDLADSVIKPLEKNLAPAIFEIITKAISEFEFDAAKHVIKTEIERQSLMPNLDRLP